MTNVIVVIGPGFIGQAIARRVGVGKRVLLADVREQNAIAAAETLGNAGYVVEPVARGDIELGIQQITEILPVAGVKLVGPLPESLQKITVYQVARPASPADCCWAAT